MITKLQALQLADLIGLHSGSHVEHVQAHAAGDTTRTVNAQAQVRADFKRLNQFIDSITVKE